MPSPPSMPPGNRSTPDLSWIDQDSNLDEPKLPALGSPELGMGSPELPALGSPELGASTRKPDRPRPVTGRRKAYVARYYDYKEVQVRIAIHRAKASAPFDSQKRVVGPPGLATMVLYMSKSLAEGALLIGLMVLSIASNSHSHRSGNSHLHPPHPSILKEASSDLQGWPKWSSICLKTSLKVPY
jgi:hypothetical protein